MSFLYLIERSDKIHGMSIGYENESMVMYFSHTLIKFHNFSGFIHIWEAISTTYPGGFEPKIANKILYLVQNLVQTYRSVWRAIIHP